MKRSVLTQEFEVVTPETRAGKLRSDLQQASTAAVLVGDDEVEGAVRPRDLLRSRLSDDAQAQTVMGSVPKPEPTAETTEVARMLVESESTVAPLVDEEGVRGVVTRDSLLRAVTETETADLDVQVVNPEHFREIDWAVITERIEGVTEKYQELDVFDARVTVQKHEESHRGESLMRCEVRLFTDEDRVAGTAEEYGATNAFDAALETLEKNVLELKGKQTASDRSETVPREVASATVRQGPRRTR